MAAIVSAALHAADASRLVERALADPSDLLRQARAVHVLAIGKAALPMASAFERHSRARVSRGLMVGPASQNRPAGPFLVLEGAHPVPDARSMSAGMAALDFAARCDSDCLVVLLSGGASAMAALPAGGVTLDAKQETTRLLLRRDVDIHSLNCVRKHLSAIKGGRLAAASAAPVLTLAVSDVVGNDPSVIGSGPTVPDPTTYADALAVLDRRGERSELPRAAIDHLERGARGEEPETPKPNDPAFARAETRVIGSGADALAGAGDAAAALGYRVIVRENPVVGEARTRADLEMAELRALVREDQHTICVLSAGETTVRVLGAGRGGRNQEYALSAARRLPAFGRPAVLASIGTDGTDGPTDAAGAIADSSTIARALQRGLDPMQYLDANDAWTFFEALGDLVRTGATDTNVGDIQVTLIGESQ